MTSKTTAKTLPQMRLAPLEEFAPYERNARLHSPEQAAQIAASIRRFGWTYPILRRGNFVIGVGHGRLEAARTIYAAGETIRMFDGTSLPLGELPYYDVSGWSERDFRAYVIADNKLAENARWDREMLALEVADLVEFDATDMNALGLDAKDVAEILAGGEAGEEDIPAPQPDTVTRSGDIWVLGRHRLMCGDSHDDAAMAALLEGREPVITVIDPPFEEQDRFARFIRDPCIVFGIGKHLLHIPADLWRFERIVDKVSGHRIAGAKIVSQHAIMVQVGSERPTPRANVSIRTVVQHRNRPEHPHEKPVSMLVEQLAYYSPAGDPVLDVYGGSGSTLMACEQIGRAARVMEMSPVYCDVIVRRWEKATGESALLAMTGESFAELAAQRLNDAAAHAVGSDSPAAGTVADPS